MNTRALIEECRDALAEELAAWDIDPPVFHLKHTHDKCVAWLESAGGCAAVEPVHLIYFDDQDRRPELFAGHGAQAAAHERFRRVSDHWNAHLFVKLESNSRNASWANANAATSPQTPGAAPAVEPVQSADLEARVAAHMVVVRRALNSGDLANGVWPFKDVAAVEASARELACEAPVRDKPRCVSQTVESERQAQQCAEPLTDEQAEALIESSDGRWHEGEFRIDSRDLMSLLRKAHGITATEPLSHRKPPTDEQIAAVVRQSALSRYPGWVDCGPGLSNAIELARAVLRLVGITATEPGERA